jgi:hypothetical protein
MSRKPTRTRAARRKERDQRAAAVRAILDQANPSVPDSPEKGAARAWLERVLLSKESAASAQDGGGGAQ